MFGYTISRYVRDPRGTVIRVTREGSYRSELEGRAALSILTDRPGPDVFVLFEPQGQSIGSSTRCSARTRTSTDDDPDSP